VARLDEQARQFAGLVRGNAAADPEKNPAHAPPIAVMQALCLLSDYFLGYS
jgi:hypothetical protein